MNVATVDQNCESGATLTLPRSRKANVLVRVGLWASLFGVLAVGFLAYLSPAMRLNWDAVASMCGF